MIFRTTAMLLFHMLTKSQHISGHYINELQASFPSEAIILTVSCPSLCLIKYRAMKVTANWAQEI